MKWKRLSNVKMPDARIAVGHGRDGTGEAGKIILDFINYEYDVLIATSIVESGIDVPNAIRSSSIIL